MFASYRSPTSAARARPSFNPRARAGGIALLGALALVGFGCGGSSSSKPADGGGTGGADAGGGGGTVGTGGSGTKIDGGADASTKDATSGGDAATGLAQFLGRACTTDFDCTLGLVCLKAGATDFYGVAGPPHGYCSVQCSNGSDQRCANIGGECLDLSNLGDGSAFYCFQTCAVGTAATATSKCQGRLDVGCAPLDPNNPTLDVLCQPTCSSNSDCPTGRNCEYGLCVPVGALAARDPVGTHCAVPTTADTCAGSTSCLRLTVASGAEKDFCTESCVLGSPSACNVASAATALTKGKNGVCFPFDANSDVGDVGYCTQQCDTGADCLDQTDTGLMCNMTIAGLPHGFCDWN